MKHAFWTEGPRACKTGLREHYEPLIEDLLAQLAASETESQQQEVAAQLHKVKAEYHDRMEAIGRLLF